MEETKQLSDNEVDSAKIGLKTVCPDFDSDCLTMTIDRASWCFHGCQNHKCAPGSNLGTAKGYCPIIHKHN